MSDKRKSEALIREGVDPLQGTNKAPMRRSFAAHLNSEPRSSFWLQGTA